MQKQRDLKHLFSRFDQAFADFLHSKLPSLEPNHKTLASLVSHLYMKGHTCLDLNLLASRDWDALALEGEVAAKFLPKDLAHSAATLPWKDGASSPLVLDKELLYLRKNWEAEQRVVESIRNRLTKTNEEVPGLKEDLDILFGSKESSEPDWQKLACALATRGTFTLITGGPGTGKTTTVAKLLALLVANARKKHSHKNFSQAKSSIAPGSSAANDSTASPEQGSLRIALCAPTGKAAARLGSSIANALKFLPEQFKFELTNKPVTLHKLLQIRSDERRAQKKPLAYDLIVIDEASMISLSLMDSLLCSAPLEASLIFLGDQDQLASVEAGAVMGQLCGDAHKGNYLPDTLSWLSVFTSKDLSHWGGAGSPLAQHTVMLRKSHRVEGGGVISQWAQLINAGQEKDLIEFKKRWGQLKTWSASAEYQSLDNPIDRLQTEYFNSFKTKEFLKHAWRRYLDLIHSTQLDDTVQEGEQQKLAKQILDAFGEFQVLCAVREGPWGVNALNKVIAKLFDFKDEGWYAGRPVMVTKNNYHLDLRNGDVGICLRKNGELRVAFPSNSTDEKDPPIRWILPSRLDSVESVFAMTVHKSQGSEFSHVCLVIPDERSAVLTKELIYTGLTRAKTRVTWIAQEESELLRAIQTRLSRSGGLRVLHTLS